MRNKSATTSTCDVPHCPKCNARLDFRRSAYPDIAACGLESYRLECRECGATLAGIIDPADDALLLTECEAPLEAALSQIAV